jgi:hypothetical protein
MRGDMCHIDTASCLNYKLALGVRMLPRNCKLTDALDKLLIRSPSNRDFQLYRLKVSPQRAHGDRCPHSWNHSGVTAFVKKGVSQTVRPLLYSKTTPPGVVLLFKILLSSHLESYAYLDTQAMDYIWHIGFAAASSGAVTYGSFVASVRREISVALVKGNHGFCRAGVQLYTRASGHARVPGYLVPTAEIK